MCWRNRNIKTNLKCWRNRNIKKIYKCWRNRNIKNKLNVGERNI